MPPTLKTLFLRCGCHFRVISVKDVILTGWHTGNRTLLYRLGLLQMCRRHCFSLLRLTISVSSVREFRETRELVSVGQAGTSHALQLRREECVLSIQRQHTLGALPPWGASYCVLPLSIHSSIRLSPSIYHWQSIRPSIHLSIHQCAGRTRTGEVTGEKDSDQRGHAGENDPDPDSHRQRGPARNSFPGPSRARPRLPQRAGAALAEGMAGPISAPKSQRICRP